MARNPALFRPSSEEQAPRNSASSAVCLAAILGVYTASDSMPSTRRCGICSAVGHNRQTCPRNDKLQCLQPPQVQSTTAGPKNFSWCGKSGKWTEVVSATSDTAHTPQAQRPSQKVQESEIVSPKGNHVTIRMERVSTGGTRHAAEFKRKSSGAMSGAERMKKARVRATLFPDRQAMSLRTDAERKHTSRAAHESPVLPADAESDADTESDADSTPEDSETEHLQDRILSSFRSGVEDEAAVKQLRAIRARQFAPKCDCSVLTEWGTCKRPACFDWDATPPAPRVGGGMRIRCHTCGTVRCSANCGLVIFNCCEHDHGNLNADYTINGEIRDAIQELLGASSSASCTLEELHACLLERGHYGKMQVPAHRQRMAGFQFPCTGGRYYVRLDMLRKILSNPEDTGAGLFPLGHPDSKLPCRSAYFEDLYIFSDDVLHRI